MAITPSAYWADLAEDLQDPEFLEAYVEESRRVAEIDEAVNSALCGREGC